MNDVSEFRSLTPPVLKLHKTLFWFIAPAFYAQSRGWPTSLNICISRSEDRGTPAMRSFSNAMYTAQLRLLLAAKMPAAAGADHDLPTLLADLHQWQPSSTTAPSRQLMDSITFCAHLHSTIAWLAFTLSSLASEQQLQGALLHADDARRQQQQLQSIFSGETHQRLLVAYIQQYCSGSVTDVLTRPTCRQGLGAWTQQWSNALR